MNKITSYGFRDMENRYMVTADMQENVCTIVEHSGSPVLLTFTKHGFDELRNILNSMYRERKGAVASEDIVGVGMTSIGVCGVATSNVELKASDVNIRPMYEVTAVHGTCNLGSEAMGKVVEETMVADTTVEAELTKSIVLFNRLHQHLHELNIYGNLTTSMRKDTTILMTNVAEQVHILGALDFKEKEKQKNKCLGSVTGRHF